MRHFYLIFFFFLSSKTGFCQTIVRGEVLEKVSRKPIPFANIGIINANIGTLSNVDGSFSLKVPEKLLDDSIVFSSLGFERKALLVRTLIGSHNTTVYLSERVVVLKEVTVHAKRLKPETFWLGNRSSRGGVMEEDTVYAGRSVSLLIDNRNPKSGREFPLYAQKARLRIFRNNLNSMRFRVRLNEMDEFTKLPGKDILEKNLIVESTIRSGWLVFDLSLQSVVVSKPFFLTFEQLTTREDRIAMINGNRDFMKKHPKNVKIDTVVFEGRKEVRKRYTGSGIDLPGVFVGISSSEFVQANFVCYTRETSFAEWKEVRGIVAATVLFSNQMPSAGRRSVGSPCKENTPEC
ncbi:MAG: carboxypeptidase-like regulatory domain-containing protein, partial [Flammeovirgaceae bacterium]